MEEEVLQVNVNLRIAHSPEQKAFIECTALRQVIRAGRRFGKTVAFSIKAVKAFLGICPKCDGTGCDYCDLGKVTPKRVLYAAPTAEQVSKFWFEVCTALKDCIDAGVLRKDETEKIIERPGTEQRIKAKTAWNANTLRGDYADLLGFEEYQLMNEDAWDEVGQPMLLDNNGTAVFIYTPPSLKSEGVSKARDPRHATKLYQKAKQKEEDGDKNWKTFHFTSYHNPTLSTEALGMLSEDMSLEAFRREILAEDDEIQLSWLVYNAFKDICKVKRFEIPSNWPVITGHDFGSANPAALVVAQAKLPLPEGAPAGLRYGDYVGFREYSPGAGFSSLQHIEKFRDMTKGYGVEQSIGGNITNEGEIRQLYGAHGWPISAPILTRVNAQIDRVIGLMEMNKFYIMDDMFRVLGQIASCMWILDSENKSTNKIKDEPKYHMLACLRTMVTYFNVDRPFLKQGVDKVKVSIW